MTDPVCSSTLAWQFTEGVSVFHLSQVYGIVEKYHIVAVLWCAGMLRGYWANMVGNGACVLVFPCMIWREMTRRDVGGYPTDPSHFFCFKEK